MPEYKIVIESTDQELDGSLDPSDKEEAAKKKLKRKKKEPKSEFGEALLTKISQVQSGIEATRFIADPLVQTIGQTYQLQGETLKAQRLNTTYANVTYGIDMGLQAATGIVMAGMGNPMMLASMAFGLAQQAYQLALETRAYTVRKNVDLYRQTYMSERLVRNISEVR
jgi:hypothetical protein